MTKYTEPNVLRNLFSQAMSDLYQQEVPAYSTLLSLVKQINAEHLTQHSEQTKLLQQFDNLHRISGERHGAIRVGTAHELRAISRLFALMGMYPVGYYDLSVANIPVHSTAFRPITQTALKQNPFRIFTSLLRVDLIENTTLKAKAQTLLTQRNIISKPLLKLINKSEQQQGVSPEDIDLFIQESVNTFRWRKEALVEETLYNALNSEHRLVADIVSFQGPHINHLTPRTLDIDAIQDAMIAEGLPAKSIIEGPPNRNVPILLRQTAFKALSETILFKQPNGSTISGTHTARFGEIEMRGAALTPKGRALYDQLLTKVRQQIVPDAEGRNASSYTQCLQTTFAEHFPDSLETLYHHGLIYVEYQINKIAAQKNQTQQLDLNTLISMNILSYSPLTYEDFLPVSAAGIFQSNLGDEHMTSLSQPSNQQAEFITALGQSPYDPFELYQTQQDDSLIKSLQQLEALYNIQFTP